MDEVTLDGAETGGNLVVPLKAEYIIGVVHPLAAETAEDHVIAVVGVEQWAIGAAGVIEKSLPGRGKLADQMIVEIQRKQDQLDATKQTLPAFVESSRQLLGEVIAASFCLQLLALLLLFLFW